jgi:hypothetical protein
MNKDTIVPSAFRVHRSELSCSLDAALLNGLFEQSAWWPNGIGQDERHSV